MTTADFPDAALIGLWRQYAELADGIERQFGDRPPSKAEWDHAVAALFPITSAIHGTPATTFAGLFVKARVATRWPAPLDDMVQATAHDLRQIGRDMRFSTGGVDVTQPATTVGALIAKANLAQGNDQVARELRAAIVHDILAMAEAKGVEL